MSAILAALEAMEVDERAWLRTWSPSGSSWVFIPLGELGSGTVYESGSVYLWIHRDDSGHASTHAAAMLAVQRARFAHAIATCNRAASRVAPPGPTARGG